jgi:hypothetical protein
MKKIPSPEASALIVCAIALCAAPQILSSYDETWLLIANLLFVAATAVYIKNRVATLPGSQGRIVISPEIWHRAKNGLIAGIIFLIAGAGWIAWSPVELQANSWTNATFVISPSILLETIGTILIVYWIALWMLGQVSKVQSHGRSDDKSEH